MALNKPSNADNVLGPSTRSKKEDLLMSGMRDLAAASSLSSPDPVPEQALRPQYQEQYNPVLFSKPKGKRGRPKQYMGETAVITLKTDKVVKDMAMAAIKSRKVTMVQYITELIERDFNDNKEHYI